MAVRKYYDLVRVGVSGTPGTGTITLGTAISGFLTFAQGGVSNAEVVTYAINDQGQSEIGYGTYTSAGTTLSRDTVLSSTNGGFGGSKISATSTAQVFIAMSARDQAGLSVDNIWTGTNSFGAAVTITAGGIAITGNSTLAGTLTITSTSASALTVGRQGSTNPVLQVDASTATVVTGLKITGAAATAGVDFSAISSGTNENLTINAKGSGTLIIQNTATGAFSVGAAGRFTVAQNTGYLGVGGNPTSTEGIIVITPTGVNQMKFRNSTGGTTGTLITQLSTGAFQFNNQDNAQLEFYTNNGSGEQFILGTSGGGLRVGASPPTPGVGGLGVTGKIMTGSGSADPGTNGVGAAGTFATSLSTNSNFTVFSGTNTNAGASAFVTANLAVTDAGTLILQGASVAAGGTSIIRWTGSGGFYIDAMNSNGVVTVRTGSGPSDTAAVGPAGNWFFNNPINTSGYTRVSSDFSVTSSTTLVNVTGLSTSVQAAGTYGFMSYLTWTDAAAGGVKASIAGTATATSIVFDGYVVESNAVKGQTGGYPGG